MHINNFKIAIFVHLLTVLVTNMHTGSVCLIGHFFPEYSQATQGWVDFIVKFFVIVAEHKTTEA